jgi:hypothetical protein
MNKNSFDSQFTSNPCIFLLSAYLSFCTIHFLAAHKSKHLIGPLKLFQMDMGLLKVLPLIHLGWYIFLTWMHRIFYVLIRKTGNTEVWHNNSNCANGLYVAGDHLFACEAVGRAVVRYDLLKGPGSRKVLMSSYNGKRLGSPNDLTVFDQKVYFSEFYLRNRLQHEPDNEREIFLTGLYFVS